MMVGEWGRRIRRGFRAGPAVGAEFAAQRPAPLSPRKGLARPHGAHDHGVRPSYGPDSEIFAVAIGEVR